MPLYKWLGNQMLTSIENKILGTALSEFHSGYRSYRTDALRRIPFHLNSDDFHFDTDIIIQLVLQQNNIKEIPMPTHYGDEKCHVNGFKYAGNCIKSAIKSKLHQAGIFFQPNFEITTKHEVRNYQLKKAPTSLHHYILEKPWRQGLSIIDLGANDGLLSKEIADKGAMVTAIDINIPGEIHGIKTIQADLNQNLMDIIPQESADAVLALDVIEHLYTPEYSTEQIHHALKNNGLLYASTANIGYIVMRITLLLGWFNYGKKGILDRTHHRLFTIGSFQRLIRNAGFNILRIEGFGPPIIDAFGDTPFWKAIDRICYTLAKIYPRLFAFNFLIIARKRMSIQEKTRLSIASQQRF
jgi:2-polyprenyl-3-methyl-5-hydroxy-6-metoxy-1,4-benzoquinol methylase